MNWKGLWLLLLLMTPSMVLADSAPAANGQKDYLYYRDVNVPAFQRLREFFDLPERPGHYEVTLVSDSLGPLTFHVYKVEGDAEILIQKYRSYSFNNHEFHVKFYNEQGNDDLIVEMANSNPAAKAKVSVIVVELP